MLKSFYKKEKQNLGIEFSDEIKKIIVATSTSYKDKPIVRLCKKKRFTSLCSHFCFFLVFFVTIILKN